MSLAKLMGTSLQDLRAMDPEKGFAVFAQKTQERNHNFQKPPKLKIAVPVSIGIIIGTSLAVISRGGRS